MNADRETELLDTIQQDIKQLKEHAWNNIQQLGNTNQNLQIGPLSDFSKAKQDLEHAKLINSMLVTREELPLEKSDSKSCEDANAFRLISQFFQNNAERFQRENPKYIYDFHNLIPSIQTIVGEQNLNFDESTFLPCISIIVANYFVVRFIFSIDHQLAFVVVHGISEINKGPFEQSDFRVFRSLAVYFSSALPDFILKYHERGIIEFIIWLQCYNDLFTTPCHECGTIIKHDLTGDLLPPIIKTISSCYGYHMACAPHEIEVPDYGYITVMSEDQMQEKNAK